MKSNFQFTTTPTFNKSFKELGKKYASLTSDLQKLKIELTENPKMGVSLGNGFRKIRMAILSKGKGKSGGARVITLHIFEDQQNGQIIFSMIYDKGERETVTNEQIKKSIQGIIQ